MSRSARAFTAGPFALEGRLLLAARFPTIPTVPAPAPPPTVQFVTAQQGTFGVPMQVVTQQAGEATVTLSRSNTTGTLQVEVTTDPSPSVGVNVGAVDQIITFADGQSLATVTVPILAGAPNPGEVGVRLIANKIIDPARIGFDAALDLKILASDPTVPPKVVSVDYTNHRLLLCFNKPMNPAGASDVNNYTVYVTYGYAQSAQIQTAQYDPATQSVTLVPKHPNSFSGGLFTTLTQIQTARTSVRRGHRSNVAGSLTDLQGNPIDASTTPGKVLLRDVYHMPSFTTGI